MNRVPSLSALQDAFPQSDKSALESWRKAVESLACY